ncbi:MAG: PD-(D/E)XK nuclease family protein [Rhodocyclaceae bacterium]|nr:PD-(D/E)XK nuclease family protein [Rhodocyclaceae bacterium]
MADLNLLKTRDAGEAGSTVVLCATHRLARNLRLAHDRAQAALGLARWRPLAALTASQWLDGVVDAALLTGELAADAVPSLVLTAAQERMLWERVIEADAGDSPEALFFDSEGLAAAAAEANALIEGWGLRVADGGELGEETRRFLHWRAEFRRRCEAAGWREPARAAAAQIAAVAGGIGSLPPRLLFAGFDRYTRQEQRLAEALRGRGCALGELELGAATDAVAGCVALPDRNAECRAAAAWAAARLAADPASRLGIVVPELAALRSSLADALDEALQPQALAAAQAEMPRRYNFSLGTALSRQPLVDTALRLLRLAAGSRRLEQAAVDELLRGAYWSADEAEADARARCEAQLRERLPPVFSVDRLLRFLRRQNAAGLAAPRLLGHLEVLRAKATAQPARQLPSQWLGSLREMLAAAGWPGERSLSSHEFQARVAFAEVVDSLGAVDGMLGRIPLAEAVSRLAQLCRERVFQPETAGDPPVQVMGPLEAAGARFDALWVMGMNDDVWPAAARPNPLLPAELQRRAGTPGASSEVEAAFALAIHRRLLKSAPEVLFSWAQGEGDRVRRPSPLIAALPPCAAPELQATLAERLCGTLPLAALDDSRAPPVARGERVGGGANLLKAQAVCPAWAYYRYRLGARALGAAVEGLDALARGSLLHAVLEAFWRGRASADMLALSAEELAAALDAAIDQALTAFDAGRDEPLPARLALLERERLLALVGRWLEIEAARPAPFRVVACEERHEIEIEGLALRLTVDRIDELADGRRVILDYKTGREPDWASWAAPRIVEPQLPVYAAYIAGEAEVEAVAFAQLRAGEEGFVGIAAAAGLLPNVAGLADKGGRRRFDAGQFPDWPSLLDHWRRAIAEIAGEVRDGVAAVVFEKEAALEHCEVKPLLRLAERRGQQASTP